MVKRRQINFEMSDTEWAKFRTYCLQHNIHATNFVVQSIRKQINILDDEKRNILDDEKRNVLNKRIDILNKKRYILDETIKALDEKINILGGYEV